jgi:heptosyltransferase-2
VKSKRAPDHLLVRAPNWVGDLVMATPVLEAACADARFGRVTIALRAHLAGVLGGGPLAERLLLLERDADEARTLARARADAALILSNSFGAAWRAFRARIPLRAGAALSGRGFLLTHRVVPPRRGGRRAPIPTAHLLRDVAGLFGIRVPSLHPRLFFEPGLAETLRADLGRLGLGAAERYAVACPGAAFGSAKLWPPERFAAVLDALHAEGGLRGIVTGGPGEEPLIRAVAAAAQSPVISLADEPRDLSRLKPLIAGAALLLVGDSGPRWYAAAFDVPCVSVLGPTDPLLTASSLERCAIVRVEGLACSPCKQRVCPLGHHRCMQDLSVGRVLDAARALLRAENPAALGCAP